jgi:hypothetical protein
MQCKAVANYYLLRSFLLLARTTIWSVVKFAKISEQIMDAIG